MTINAATNAFGELIYRENGDLKWNAYNDFNTDNYVLGNSGGARFLLTQSGNLGLGVTPSAWNVGRVLQINTSGAFVYGSSNNTIYGLNSYFESGWKYTNTAAASYYEQFAGAHQWFNAPSGTAGNAISFTQAMTLGSNSGLSIGTPSAAPAQGLLVQGNVGIGTTNFDLWGFGNFGGGSINQKSIIYGGNSYIGSQVGSNIAAINFAVDNTTSSPDIINRIVSVVTSTINNSESGYLSFFTKSGAISTSSEERMRITNSGNVAIGTITTNTLLNINVPSSSTNGLSLIDTTTVPVVFTYSSVTGENRIGGLLSYVFPTFYSGGSERMRIWNSSGNVNIGPTPTSDAGFKLDVNGTGRFSGSASTPVTLTLTSANSNCDITMQSANSSSVSRIRNGTNDLQLHTNGSLALTLASNQAATFSSSVTATSFFESSDATIKTLVQDSYQAKGIESVIAKLYIKNGKQELGYYAQDLEGVLPSAVSKGSNGLLNLSYREVHTAKIAYLEQKIKRLENELGRLS
jgi:hypothetical protein